ncbi:MAG: hypothetical protein ABI137_08115 [Antricoccus sp.]
MTNDARGQDSLLGKYGFPKTPVSYLDYTANGIRLIEQLVVTEPQFLDYVGVI